MIEVLTVESFDFEHSLHHWDRFAWMRPIVTLLVRMHWVNAGPCGWACSTQTQAHRSWCVSVLCELLHEVQFCRFIVGGKQTRLTSCLIWEGRCSIGDPCSSWSQLKEHPLSKGYHPRRRPFCTTLFLMCRTMVNGVIQRSTHHVSAPTKELIMWNFTFNNL